MKRRCSKYITGFCLMNNFICFPSRAFATLGISKFPLKCLSFSAKPLTYKQNIPTFCSVTEIADSKSVSHVTIRSRNKAETCQWWELFQFLNNRIVLFRAQIVRQNGLIHHSSCIWKETKILKKRYLCHQALKFSEIGKKIRVWEEVDKTT